MVDYDRFVVDDGRHEPQIVIYEDASAAAGEAQHRALCSCGRLPPHRPGTPQQAWAAYAAHARRCLGPASQPASRVSLGMRVTLLFLGCMVLWGAGWTAAVSVANTLDLAGGADLAVRAAGLLVGFASAGLLMLAMRRFIAPMRADG
ncbi:hypothetical protein [Streptomyces lancefieldiae]|uniref:Uncharacterized protein n=1 Tax=Streptomyces lancefieldiae TaxID=3075520 RepID=A0ABU3B197_9ACTN|nr:hypothetical protein [Streptomyces sp. DSM 40712]MDT0616225.1 hypothetical protein [Streptomyces sp. DSM 40712]